MLQRLIKIIDNMASSESAESALPAQDYKLATAALLVHATLVDGKADDSERGKLRQLLQDHFELQETEVDEFIQLAEHEERRAVDLYGFTRRISKELEPDERLKIIEMLWEIAFCDGVLHEYETHLIWRVAELLHVSTHDRIKLRKLVEKRQSQS